jgi:ABC-2 type transport system ATP-binding protein
MKIEVRQLRVCYGRFAALDDVSFEVESGAVFALVGRNGAGKSSLVRALLGQRRADGGTIAINGLDPWRQRARLMERVGSMPETPDAPPALGAIALGELVARFYPAWDREGYRDRLDRFGIPLDRAFAKLSRGQRALVQLSLALAPRPRALVLDDPTLGLDAVARRFLFDELIGELAERGVTIFLTSHDLAGVERVATHIGILRDGRLASFGPLEALREEAVREGLETPTLEEIFVARTGEGGAR